jgi:hypothetical protein
VRHAQGLELGDLDRHALPPFRLYIQQVQDPGQNAVTRMDSSRMTVIDMGHTSFRVAAILGRVAEAGLKGP